MIENGDLITESREHSAQDYSRAMTEIDRLEKELSNTQLALDASLKTRDLMGESLKACAETLLAVEDQLRSTEAAIMYSNFCIQECINHFKYENGVMKSAADAWLNECIHLKFALLSANDRIKTLEAERESSNKSVPSGPDRGLQS